MNTKNPWLGLASYEEPQSNTDNYLFCGRDEETLDMVCQIDNNLFVTLYGSSGIGKTSLLRAGVMPVLRRRDYFPIYIRLSQEPASLSYAEAIVGRLQDGRLKVERLTSDAHNDGNDRLYLWNYFATTRFYSGEREVYPVIILDQFEEIFRNSDKNKAELLLKQMYPLLNDELEIPSDKGYNTETNYRFVASIREDFLFVLEDSIDELALGLYKNNRYRLRPMKPEQARAVVLLPGKGCIDEGQKDAIADRIVTLSKRNERGEVDTLLLSLVCAGTYDKKSGEKIVVDDLAVWKDNILSVYKERLKESRVSQRVIRKLEQTLVRDNGTRRLMALNDLPERQQKACKMLSEVHLVKIDNFDEKGCRGLQYVEIIHDRIAEVIAYQRHEVGKKNRLLFSRIALVLLLIFIFCFTFWNQLWTTNEKKARAYPYMEYRDMTTEEKSSSSSSINREYLERILCDSRYVSATCCPRLETIDASDYTDSCLSIRAIDCDNLRYVLLNDKIKDLSLTIDGSHQIRQIRLPDEITRLKIDVELKKIIFNIDSKNKCFKWNDSVLWDLSNKELLYAASGVPNKVTAPFDTYSRKFICENKVIEANSELLIGGKRVLEDNGVIDLRESGITKIPFGAFKNRTTLECIYLPGTLERICSDAFFGCENLKQVWFDGNSKVDIGYDAFVDCNSLEYVNFPKYVYLNSRSFSDCRSLRRVWFGDTAEVNSDAFFRCYELEEVRLPNTYIPRSVLGGNWYDCPFGACPKARWLYDSCYWERNRGVIVNKMNEDVVLIDGATTHTFINAYGYFSKNGCLHRRDSALSLFDEPVATISAGKCFVHLGNLFIKNSSNDTSLSFRLRYKEVHSLLWEPPVNLSEVHLPFGNPTLLGLGIDLSTKDKSHVTLYVPYGCSKYFVNDYFFQGFKEIREESLITSVWNIAKFYLTMDYRNLFWGYLPIALFAAIVIMSVKTRSGKMRITWMDLFNVVYTTCITVVIYWFMYLTIIPVTAAPVITSILSCFVAALIAIICSDFLVTGLEFEFMSALFFDKKAAKRQSEIFHQNPKKYKKFLVVAYGIMIPFGVASFLLSCAIAPDDFFDDPRAISVVITIGTFVGCVGAYIARRIILKS